MLLDCTAAGHQCADPGVGVHVGDVWGECFQLSTVGVLGGSGGDINK